MTKAQKIWNEMNFMQRSEVMATVGYQRSQVKFLRACLKWIQENM